MDDSLALVNSQVVACRKCPRLVQWREQVAREKRAAFREEQYWGRPVPGFGELPIWLRVLVTTLVLTPIMTYWVLPWVTRALRRWLAR